jgi:WD40 repeat protein
VPLDHRTDIYALGVTLYELLTLEPAFDGPDRQEVLRQIACEEPYLPRHRNRSIPAELETVVLKALEKNPAERYATAHDLAEDLRRFLEDRTILAKRPRLVQRAGKWVRRHKPVVWSTAVSALALLVLTVVALAWGNFRIAQERDQKDAALTRAQQNADEARSQKKLAIEPLRRAEQAELTARRRFYAGQMHLAHQAWEAGNPARVLELLEGQRPGPEETDLRSFEWYYLWRLCRQRHRFSLKVPEKQVAWLAFSPDGKTLAAASLGRTVRLWQAATGRQQATFKEAWGAGQGMAFTPDGKALLGATLDAPAKLKRWDLATGQGRDFLDTHQQSVRCLAFSPDGKVVATGGGDGTVKVWSADTWQERATLPGHKDHVHCMAFSPDGGKLATASAWGDDNGDVKIWDLASRSSRRLPGTGAYELTFSPDGQSLAAGGNESGLRLFDVATGRQRTALEGPKGVVMSVAFAPDGKTLASGGNDRTVRLWDAGTWQLRTSYADSSPVYAVRFSPDGRVLAAAGYDGTVTFRDTATARDELVLPGAGAFVAFSPDGKTLASAGPEALKLWDVRAPGGSWKETALRFEGGTDPAEALAFAHDGQTLAVARGHTLKLFDVAPARERVSVTGATVFWSAAFSPDDKTLASASAVVPVVSLRDSSTLQVRATLAPDPVAWARIAGFSPDGTTLATGGQFAVLKLFDGATGRDRATLQPSAGGGMDWVFCVAFSPDGKLLASGDGQGTVKLWDVAAEKLCTTLKGHTDGVFALAFTADGRTLATGGDDRTVKLWDAATGQERITLRGFKAAVRSLAFSPDGTLLAAGSWDATVQVWQAAREPEALARKAPAGQEP